MTEELSLNDYAERMETALKGRQEFSTFNKDMLHAQIVVCTALEYAEDRVRLLSNRLDPDLYASVWFNDAARGFLARGGHLDILVETDVGADHPLMSLQAEAGPDRMAIHRVPDAIVDGYDFNFMVMDDRGFRFEENRDEPKALVVFDRDTDAHRRNVEALANVFSTLESTATA